MSRLSKINDAIDAKDSTRMGKQIVMICIGNAMLAVAMNFIVTPFNLYCSGAMGVAQLIAVFMENILHIPSIPGVEWLGIVYWGINIPVLIFGAKSLGKKFLIRTIISITVLSLFIGVIPVFSSSIIENEVMGCIAAGVFGGIGVGFVLTSGAGCGAGDVIGMVLSSTKPGFSVGTMNMIINICIYTICAFAYGLENAVYSIFFAAILSWAMDKYHKQNHYIQILMYTKNMDVSKDLTLKLDRGITYWQAKGAYTDTETQVVSIIVTKHEVDKAVEILRGCDPSAFISVSEIEKVHGTFDKHFSK